MNNLPTTTLTFAALVKQVVTLINLLIPLLGTIALLVFFWGLVRYIYASSDTHAHADGKEIMIWGLVAMFVLVSVWGIVELACVAFFGSHCSAMNEAFNL